MKIYLNDIRLFGYHGLYPLEKKMGNEFLIQVELEVDVPETTLQLEDTIDYAKVFSVVKKEFEIPEELLENLVYRIANTLVKIFPSIQEVKLNVIKTNPPLEGFTGSVGVGYHRKIR